MNCQGHRHILCLANVFVESTCGPQLPTASLSKGVWMDVAGSDCNTMHCLVANQNARWLLKLQNLSLNYQEHVQANSSLTGSTAKAIWLFVSADVSSSSSWFVASVLTNLPPSSVFAFFQSEGDPCLVECGCSLLCHKVDAYRRFGLK